MGRYSGMPINDWRTLITRALRIHEPGKLGYKPWRKRRDRQRGKQQLRCEENN